MTNIVEGVFQNVMMPCSFGQRIEKPNLPMGQEVPMECWWKDGSPAVESLSNRRRFDIRTNPEASNESHRKKA